MRGRPAIRAKRATTIDDGRAGRPLCGSREPFRHSRSCAHPPLLTLLVSRLRTGISVACWSERRPLGSNAENLTEESMTSERVLRLASIVAFVLGAILVAIGVYRYVNGGGLSSPIGAGLGAMVIAGICSQIANRGRDQREGQPREESPKIPG